MSSENRLIPPHEYREMPWKNGLGVTAEIDREPMQGDRYLWRLSQAKIQSDCQFSLFPGYDRWLMVIQGEGMSLNEQRLKPFQPFHFSGHKLMNCELLAGTILDLGLIYDRLKISAEMAFVEGPLNLQVRTIHYLFDMQSFHTLKISGGGIFQVEPSVLIAIHRKD